MNATPTTAPPARATDPVRPLRVLLVDDQAMIGEAVRRMLAAETDIDYLYCGDPTKAMQVAVEFQPTVILQDLVMPEIDGLTMLKFYRANPATREVPTIVLSTKEEPKVKAEAFTLGANDYLVKLPDPIELAARVRHHSRGYIAQLERNAAYAALKRSEERLADELAQAAKYVTSLLPDRLAGDIRTDWHFIPSVELGGDAFGYHWLDDEHFAMFVLDVCGHGLKSALLSISAMDVMRNQTLPKTDFRSPASVLGGMNEAFQMERQNNMYFTLWYGVYNRRTRRLAHASGGHPAGILMPPDGGAPQELLSPGMIVGAFPGMPFEEQAVEVAPGSRLYIFSDGIYEVTRPDDSMVTFQEFVGIVSRAPQGATMPFAIEAIRAERGQPDFEDDVSLVEVTF
jgi:phosphoserine phosphatase RsbU/P